MGPVQCSSNMTITPSRTGILTIAPYQLPPATMASSTLQIPMYNVQTTLENPALPSLNRGLQTTLATIIPSPVLPSCFHSLFGAINIPSASSHNGPVAQGVPPITLTQPIVSESVSQTLVNTPPFETTSVTTSPNVAGTFLPNNPSYTPTPIVKRKVVNTPPFETTSVTTSPNVAGTYSPNNPSYTPTPIVKHKVVKVSIQSAMVARPTRLKKHVKKT